MSKQKRLPPTHPGEILLEEFMKPFGLTAHGLASDLGLPATRIGDLIHGRRGVTPETAIALAEYFKTSVDFWLGIQMQYDRERAEDEIGAEVRSRVRRRDLVPT
jgi:addiction module HigA family antidote